MVKYERAGVRAQAYGLPPEKKLVILELARARRPLPSRPRARAMRFSAHSCVRSILPCVRAEWRSVRVRWSHEVTHSRRFESSHLAKLAAFLVGLDFFAGGYRLGFGSYDGVRLGTLDRHALASARATLKRSS